MDRIDPIDRDFLIKVGEACANPAHPAMAAVLEALKTKPRCDPADEDEIEAFDKALDAAEGAARP